MRLIALDIIGADENNRRRNKCVKSKSELPRSIATLSDRSFGRYRSCGNVFLFHIVGGSLKNEVEPHEVEPTYDRG